MSLDEQPPKAKRTGKKRGPTRDKAGVVPTTANVVNLFGPDADKRDDPDSLVPARDRSDVRQGAKKVRISGRIAQVMRDIEDGKMTMKEFVKSLDKEELVRGQMKDKNGHWHGAPPKWVPSELHQECVRELLRRGDQIWREAYLDAVGVYQKIATDDTIEPKDRLKAAQYIIERLAGKTPERLELAVVDPWEQIITGIVAEAEDEAISRAARIMNGEVAADG